MSDLDEKVLPVGKLKPEFLAGLLDKYTSRDDRVVVGPRIGEDATVIDMGDTYLVAKTDPITFVTDEIGFYALAINANDIACMGARPRWFLASLLLPEGQSTPRLVESIFAQLSQACEAMDVALCGGHTEVTYGIDRPLIVGQMLGEVPRDALVTSSGLRIGDEIILTKGIPIEAASIIAREKTDELLESFSSEFVQRCRNLIRDPGISVLRDAQLACQSGEVHAMHDPTEGGLASGLWELAHASKVGLEIQRSHINIIPECEVLCKRFGLDPLGAIASGALLIGTPRRYAANIVDALSKQGITATVIGKVVEPQNGLSMKTPQGVVPLPRFERDEIAKLFELEKDGSP